VAKHTLPVPISLENEKNPWIAAETRFDEAAMRLKLDDGMRKDCAPLQGAHRHIPVLLDDGRIEVFTGYRVQHSLARGPAKAASASPRRDPRRGPRAGLLDDLEMRRREYSVRRRKGRRHLRSPPALRRRIGKAHRRYTAEIIDFLGPERDVPAPDSTPTRR